MKKFLSCFALAAMLVLGDGGTVFADGLYLGAGTGQSWNESGAVNNATPFYAQIGNDFGRFRAEVEYQRLDGQAGSGKVDGNLLLSRVYIENSYGAVTPYLSGAAGYGWLSGPGVVGNGEGPILGAGAGIDYNLTKGWSAVVGYEFLSSTEKSVSESGVNEWQNHTLRVGIRKEI